MYKRIYDGTKVKLHVKIIIITIVLSFSAIYYYMIIRDFIWYDKKGWLFFVLYCFFVFMFYSFFCFILFSRLRDSAHISG